MRPDVSIRESLKTGELPQGDEWFDIEKLDAEGNDYRTGAGAGANPRIGRMIFLQNRDHIVRLTPVIKRLHESDPNRPLNICITAAIGGGTSTGMLLDLCYALKKIMDRLNIPGKSITLFLMEAEPDEGEPDREAKLETYNSNKKAIVRQLARFFAARNSAFAPDSESEPLPQWFDYIFWSSKKRDYRNDNDLYPQTAAMMYEWTLEKSFRDYVRTQSQYVSSGLLVHSGRTEGLFLYKRLLEQFFSAQLVLKILMKSVIGFSSGTVTDFSPENCERDEKTVSQLIQLLLEKEEWEPARPRLLKENRLIVAPNSANLSRFLAKGGFKGISENSS
ncbi:MAG: hypothetical protein GY757_55870, partial [bacterium]|nr:hypothetical protein [bacterium]